MLGPVLEKIDSWLGKSFFLARLAPWLLFALANLGLAAIEFPWARDFLAREYDRLGSDRVVDLAISVILVAVVAYTVSPAMQWAISLLEGRNLPRLFAAPLLVRRRYEFDRLATQARNLFRARARLPDKDDILQRLSLARLAGTEYGTVTDPRAITTAQSAISTLHALRQINLPISSTRLSVAVETLRNALARNCADAFALKPPVTKQIIEQSEALDRLHDDMSKVIIPYATDVAQTLEAYAYETHDKLFASAELAPTRLGNDVAALRSYCETRYGFDYDFFWPRLQLILNDQKLIDKLTAAKIQVEYSALSLCLSVVLTASWLIVLYFYGRTITAFALVAITGPILIYVWLWMVHESYSALAELIRSTIDLKRFELLMALHRPLPAKPGVEKASWEELGQLLRLNNSDAAAEFKHPPS
jgi:hypothetical protein